MTGYEVIADVAAQAPSWVIGLIEAALFLGILGLCWASYLGIGHQSRKGHIQKARLCALLLFGGICCAVAFLLHQLGVI